MAADSALEQTRQQGRGRYQARRSSGRCAGFPFSPDALEGGGVDDGGHGGLDPFRWWTVGVGLGVADVSEIVAHIDRIGQQGVRLVDVPRLAPHQQPLLGQMLGDLLAAHRTALAAVQVEVISHAHNPRLRFMDGELLFMTAPTACNVGDDSLITKGRAGAVEEPLPCVLLHAA